MALGQGVLETLVDVLLVDDGFQLQEAAEEMPSSWALAVAAIL